MWDGLYSTLWGDSTLAGIAPALIDRPPWSYDYMVAGMGLALAPTAAVLLAAGVMLVRFLRKPTMPWAFLLLTAFLVALALLYCPLLVPCSGAVKASYGLAGYVPFCVLAAVGFDLLPKPARWIGGLPFVILGVLALNAAFSYWISPTALESETYAARQLVLQGKTAEATEAIEHYMVGYPNDVRLRTMLAQLSGQANHYDRERQLLELPAGQHDFPERHRLLAAMASREGRRKDAMAELQRTMELSPHNVQTAVSYAIVVGSGGDVQATIDAWRNALRIAPDVGELHATLAKLYRHAGDRESARRHEEYANSLDRYWKSRDARKF